MATTASSPAVPQSLSRNHLKRLRHYYRSAGWPCRDNIEIELVAHGLVTRRLDGAGLETIAVTDAGIAVLRDYLDGNRRARDAHEELVTRVAVMLQADRRLVFRGLGLRASVDDRWQLVRPDVYSIRQSPVAAYVHPVVHEIKVRRADLRSDLKTTAKRRGYQALSREFYYVIACDIASPEEIPDDCGVMIADCEQIRVVRPSPLRDVTLRTDQWTALARATCEPHVDDPRQLELGAPGPFSLDGAGVNSEQ
jgi:hypothetical protein